MADKVHVLGGGQLPEKNGEPNPDAVAYCEKLLELAKSGMLQWVGHAALSSEGFFSTGWMRTSEGQMLKAAGAVAILNHEFIASTRDA